VGGGRLRGIAFFLGACLAVAAVAAVAGVVFQLVRGGTTIPRSVAYSLWIAAAVALVVMLPAGSKRLWRTSSLPPLERWWFVAASTLLTAAGALVDGLGSP
jgi:uncharacterized membrane protein